MPLIAYLRAHGVTDFPHHFVFFGHLEKLGILDKYDFAIDTIYDPEYARRLVHRFPQLKLIDDVSRPRRWMNWVKDNVGRAYRPLSYLDTKVDAAVESPGGRIHELYMSGGVFHMFPRVKRTAILFHSVEPGGLKDPGNRESVARADLVVARTSKSAQNARDVGAKWVVDSSDIVFLEHPRPEIIDCEGIAVALRLPNRGVTDAYLETVRDVVGRLRAYPKRVDFVRVEEPIGREMHLSGLGTYCTPNKGLFFDDTMYCPFVLRREAIVSSRLHTTLISLLYGNRKILQLHVETGTNKSEEILGDIGISSIKVYRQGDLNWRLIEQFLDGEPNLPEAEAQAALDQARARTLKGMDAFLEWLDTIK